MKFVLLPAVDILTSVSFSWDLLKDPFFDILR
jgi:hypothetical protein